MVAHEFAEAPSGAGRLYCGAGWQVAALGNGPLPSALDDTGMALALSGSEAASCSQRRMRSDCLTVEQSRCNLLRFLETLWRRDRLDLELTER